jgi:hypothetical protein
VSVLFPLTSDVCYEISQDLKITHANCSPNIKVFSEKPKEEKKEQHTSAGMI